MQSHQFIPNTCKNFAFNPFPITVTVRIPALDLLMALSLLPPSECPAVCPVLRKDASNQEGGIGLRNLAFGEMLA